MMKTTDQMLDNAYTEGYEFQTNNGGFFEDAQKACPYSERTQRYLRQSWLRGWQDAKNDVLNSYE